MEVVRSCASNRSIMEASERRLVVTGIAAPPISKRSNEIAMRDPRDPEAALGRVTSTTCPTSLAPVRIRVWEDNGTFCITWASIFCPTLAFLASSVVRSITGMTVPAGISCAVKPEATRSEEHTSELQSLRHLECRLLLEKKQLNTNPL